MDTHSQAVATLSLAGILAASPFGLQVETIAIGTAFSVIGVIGRAAFEWQRAVEQPGQSKMRAASILGWIGAGFIGAPFATILYLIGLKIMGVQSDSIAIIGLLFFGFSGPKGITWLMNLIRDAIAARLGAKPPPPAAG